MAKSAKIAAIIVAAGQSSRMGEGTPKPYRKLKNKPIIQYGIDLFEAQNIAVILAINPDHAEYYEPLGCDTIAGGETRQESVCNALEHLAAQKPDYVLIHDAARPLVDEDTVKRVIKALKKHEAVVPAIAVVDTIKQVEGDVISATIPRETLRAIQTPQGFQFDAIYDAHQKAKGQNLTDDGAIIESAGGSVHVVEGSPRNIKLTTPDDWNLMTHLLEIQTETRTAMGYDVHALINDIARPLMICGVEISSDYALDGHSDADVGLHAITDAILGIIAAGDIGQHFPPSDPKWENKDSSAFVQHAMNLLEEAGGQITHVDVTLLAETPKISPHRKSMQSKVAELLGISVERVSIKATTTEKLGFIGRKEGIAAQAVVTAKIIT